jgi:hypothetical protein
VSIPIVEIKSEPTTVNLTVEDIERTKEKSQRIGKDFLLCFLEMVNETMIFRDDDLRDDRPDDGFLSILRSVLRKLRGVISHPERPARV